MSDAKETKDTLPEWLTEERVDTVIIAFPDVYGRLMGKRTTREFFIANVLPHGNHACNYLMTCDIEMNPLPGFKLASWDQGYGDFYIRIDPKTLRLLPWHEKTVEESPRRVLAKQLERSAHHKLKAFMGSELEFFLFDQSYSTISGNEYRDMRPTSQYLIDYHILQPGRDEKFIRRVRNEMAAAGIPVECSKGEWGYGQHELNLAYAEAMEMADRHIIYKTGTKEIAAQDEKAVTFMAKQKSDDAGSSFHLHTSLWDMDANNNLFWDQERKTESRLFRQFLGGLLKFSRELTYFFSPTINSYKRYQHSSWAPTAIVCGHDNRTCGFRIVGKNNSLRIENRMPGADANPYLTFAATLAAGLRGIDEDLDCGELYHGNAYDDDKLPRLPTTLEEAARLLKQSEIAHAAFGDEVVEFYVRMAELEVEAYKRAVTDWERKRYFEQI